MHLETKWVGGEVSVHISFHTKPTHFALYCLQVSDGTYQAMVTDASQVLQGQTFTTLQTDGGEETIIIVQAADPNEVTHAIVEQDGENVQFAMQPGEEGQTSDGNAMFTTM